MKIRLLLPPLVVLSLLVFSAFSARSQTVVTFDDLSQTSTGLVYATIPNGYQGLTWSNMWVVNAVLLAATSGSNGYYYGMVSASNVAFNAGGNPAEIDSPGTNFDFLGAYFTGAWNNNLSIEVQGYSDTNLIYDETLVASATNPTLLTLDYLDIDRLYFNSYGGQAVGFGQGGGEQFVMDNFEFEYVPEPSSLLLAALGGVSLVAFLRRKRA